MSPDGVHYLGNYGTGSVALYGPQGQTVYVSSGTCYGCAVGWIDNAHFIVAGTGDGGIRVYGTTNGDSGAPVNVKGDPVVRIPGSLDGA